MYEGVKVIGSCCVSLKIEQASKLGFRTSRDKSDLHEKQVYTFVCGLSAVMFADVELCHYQWLHFTHFDSIGL